jgi:putative transposase
MVTTQLRRETAALLCEKGVSMRRGCVFVGISRNAMGYVSRRCPDSALVEAINQVRRKHPCYGYRRTHKELTQRAKGVLNHKRVHRVWRENAMQHPQKKQRRRRGEKGQVPLRAAYANHVWTYDFVEDATQDGRKLRVLTLADEHTRRGLAVEVRRSFKANDVLAVLKAAFAQYGMPAFLRSDNGSEFIAQAVRYWLEKVQVQTHYIDPGSPWQNAFGESFNGTLRREHLNRELFATLDEARVSTETWRRYYNTQRRHTMIDYRTPQQYFEETAGASASLLGALPPNPQDLPHDADPVQTKNEAEQIAPPHSTVFGPATALGSLPSVALSSGRAGLSLPQQPPAPSRSKLNQEILSLRMAHKTGA